MSKKLYRRLLVFHIVAAMAAGAIDIVFPSLIPDVYLEAQEYHSDSRSDEFVIITSIAFLLALVLVLVASWGLYTFRSWAPKLALAVTFFALIGYVAVGPVVESGVATALFDVAAMAWGASLVLTFVQPYCRWFDPAVDSKNGKTLAEPT